jgi:ABC-2 type transport system ATP-binding protein
VGDAPFQKKCLDRIKQMQNEGRSIILVTHDTGTVENFCDAAVVLDHGKLLTLGDTKSVVAAYQALP